MTLRHPSLKFYGLVYAWYVKLNNQFANFIFNHFLLFQHFVENPKGLSKVYYQRLYKRKVNIEKNTCSHENTHIFLRSTNYITQTQIKNITNKFRQCSYNPLHHKLIDLFLYRPMRLPQEWRSAMFPSHESMTALRFVTGR